MAMEISAARTALLRARDCLRAIEQELNAADGRMGDGDTGVMLRRLFDAMADAAPDAGDGDLGQWFGSLAGVAADSTGSSLGTLVAMGLMHVSGQVQGRSALPWEELGAQLIGVRDAMIAVGGASLGDKTVLDGLDAVANAIAGQSDPEAMRIAAADAARTVLAEFHGRPCKVGRARMYGEKSVGLDDPGMLAFVRVTLAVTQPAGA